MFRANYNVKHTHICSMNLPFFTLKKVKEMWPAVSAGCNVVRRKPSEVIASTAPISYYLLSMIMKQ